MLHSWGWDITTTKSTLQCWSAPVFPPRPHPDLLSPASHPSPPASPAASPPTSPPTSHLPPTPASSPGPPSTSSPTSPSSMHLTGPGEWVWPGAELTGPGLRPPPPPPLPLTPGIGSPPGAFCFPAAAEEDVDDVYRYKQQLRTEQLVQAYMDAVRQSLEQEYSTNNNTSSSNNNSSNNNNSLSSHSNSTNCTSTTSDTPAIRYLQQLLPFAYSPSVLQADVHAAAQDDGKPLDLSATSQQVHKLHSEERDATSPPSSNKPAVELKVPQILKSGKKKDLNGKKAYTEDELAAAVQDIRSGKLGTRRAAVLYGIPRSTLRNKIFKLESEQNGTGAENGTAPHDNKLSMVDLLQGVPNGDYPPSAGFSLTDDLTSKHMFPYSEEMWEQKIEQIRRKHNLLQPDRKFGMPPMHFPSGHHLSDFEKSYLGSPFGSDLKLAFLPELVRRMAEERMELERQQSLHSLQQLDLRVARHGLPHGLPHGLTLNGHHADTANNNNNNNNTGVELRVPSYKPMRTTFRNGFMANQQHHANGEEEAERPTSPTHNTNLTPKIGDTLKDIIAKTIAEKMRCRAMLSSNMQQLNINSQLAGHSHPGPLSSDSSSISSNDMGPVEKRPRLSKDGGHSKGGDDKKHSSCSDSNNSSSENKSLRKTRPKRGQYRKYNSQLLLEAVRAVQRGEMSVHRAGSYFGVPHSTLEYKVKERHLLRLKKPRDGGRSKKEGAVSPGGGGTPSSSAATTSCTTPTPSQSSSRSATPVCSLSPPLPAGCPTNSAMSVISSLAHQASSPGSHRLPHGSGSLSSSLSSSMSLGLGAWSSPSNCSSLPLLPADPGMAAYPAGFALNTSASELLKKLQRKVQAKASLTDSQSTGEMAAALRSAAAMAAAAASTNQTSSNTEAAPVTAQ